MNHTAWCWWGPPKMNQEQLYERNRHQGSQEGLTSEHLGAFLSQASCIGVRQCGASVLM